MVRGAGVTIRGAWFTLIAAGVTLRGAGFMLMGAGGGGAGGLDTLGLTGRGAAGSCASLDPDSDLRYKGSGFSPFSIDFI